jgi:uncharacterized protein YbjT (DUF2867 family)
MRVLVTGAYGLIGSACLARLHADGHDLVAAGRSIGMARRGFPYAQWIEADFARLRDVAAWRALLKNIDAVVNCVGVLQDGVRDNVESVQFAGTVALFDACEDASVKRVVHFSAIGADEAGPSSFSRTKAAADAHLQALALDWVILRPALVLAQGVYGGTAMLRGIAAFPGIVPVIGAPARIQVVSLDDVVETVSRALAPGAPSRVVWEMAHPQVHRLADIVTAIRGWLGLAPRRVLRLPDACAKIVAAVTDAVGWLGWRSPARTTSLAQLAAGVVGSPENWMEATGVRPQSLDQILAARPASVQDRWFARLYLLKPLAIVGLAVAAIAPSLEELFTFWRLRPDLYGVSFPSIAAYVLPAVVASAITLMAGIGLFARATARLALIVLFALTLLQIADHVIRPWHYMAGPFEAFVFKIPILLAMLFTLAILDER